MTALCYLDHNATSPVRPEVVALMAELQALPLNPSSVHAHGRKAKHLLSEARREVAERFSVFPHEMIFTASATEANNMALRGFPGRPLLVSRTSVIGRPRPPGVWPRRRRMSRQ